MNKAAIYQLLSRKLTFLFLCMGAFLIISGNGSGSVGCGAAVVTVAAFSSQIN